MKIFIWRIIITCISLSRYLYRSLLRKRNRKGVDGYLADDAPERRRGKKGRRRRGRRRWCNCGSCTEGRPRRGQWGGGRSMRRSTEPAPELSSSLEPRRRRQRDEVGGESPSTGPSPPQPGDDCAVAPPSSDSVVTVGSLVSCQQPDLSTTIQIAI